MTLINTNGMAFFGPGSEWFWASLQFTALAITFIAIYRQLQTARSARAVEQVAVYTRQFDDERMARHQLAILIALRDRSETPRGPGLTLGNYFEALAGLCRSGHFDTKLLWSFFGLRTTLWWGVLQPFVQRIRAEQGDYVFGDFEWLVGVLDRMNRRAGMSSAMDAASVANWLAAGGIEGLQDNIRIEQSLRSVIIAPSDSLDTAQSVAAAPAPSSTAESAQERQSD